MKIESCAILGLGKFGMSVAIELARAGVEVLAVDISEERVHLAAEYVTCAVKANVCDPDAMANLGLSNMDVVVVAITNDLNASILGTILAKEEGVSYVVAKVGNDVHARILQKVGADRIVVPEKEYGARLARNIISGNFIDFIELSENIRMVEIPVKEDWVGKNLKQLNLRKNYKANVIAIRKGSDMIINPEPDMPLQEKCSLLLTVDKKHVSKLGL